MGAPTRLGDVLRAPDADGFAPVGVIRKVLTATGAGADDVVVYSGNAPFALRILDVTMVVDGAVALSSATLRSATGGGGSALSSALGGTSVGVKRNDADATPTVPADGTVVLRRSSGNITGELLVWVQRA